VAQPENAPPPLIQAEQLNSNKIRMKKIVGIKSLLTLSYKRTTIKTFKDSTEHQLQVGIGDVGK